jgi:Flp pilus assembly CpaE family ATPase
VEPVSNQIRVLIIEDNRIEARQTQQWLTAGKSDEFTVQWADQLAPGLEFLTEHECDIILLDLNLPDSRGFETFERVHQQFPHVPLIVLTGQDDEELGAKAVELGAQDYLVKHEVDGAKLTRVIRYALARHRSFVEALGKSQHSAGKVIGFLGAKGGVGTTTLALNVAASLTRQRKSVIVAELRPSYGSIAYHLKQEPPRSLFSLLALPPERIGEPELRSVLCKGPAEMRILFGPQPSEGFVSLERAPAEAIVTALARMADFVILDLPSILTQGTQGVVPLCQFVGLVTEREPCSIASATVAHDQLQSWRMGGQLVGTIVVNRTIYPITPELSKIQSEIGCDIVGIVPNAPAICLKAQEEGTPVVLALPEHEVSISLSEIAKNVTAARVTALHF